MQASEESQRRRLSKVQPVKSLILLSGKSQVEAEFADNFQVQPRLARSENAVGEYILFRVGRSDFTMEAMRVRGILPAQELKPSNTRHSWLCGFASMRGSEFPVIDLHRKLNLAPSSHGRFPSIVVVEVAASVGTWLIGFLVDRISRVVELRSRDFRNGIVRLTGRPRRVLDPDRILSEQELLSLLQLSPPE